MTSLGWALTLAAIAALLALDLVVSARRSGPVGLRVAGAWSVFYVGVALAFGVVLGVLSGWDLGTQYFAGYVVEKSLSIDNLFVFVIIVAAFAVPPAQQPLDGHGVTGLQVAGLAHLAHGTATEHPEKLEPPRDYFRAVHCPPISRLPRRR